LTNFKTVLFLTAVLLILAFGCAARPPKSTVPSTPVAEPPSTIPSPEPADRVKEPTPRALASLRLTEQAQWLIASKKPDQAIRILEKSLNIDPGNGRNYYFLAEAWIIKGDKTQAIEFNRLAENYLKEDVSWLEKVQKQKERIEEMRNTD